MRDLLLSEPVSWLRQSWPIALGAGTALPTIPIALPLGSDVDSRRTVLLADALGLAVFSVLGCTVGLGRRTGERPRAHSTPGNAGSRVAHWYHVRIDRDGGVFMEHCEYG